MQHFTKDNIPTDGSWGRYVKRHITSALRIEGPFTVETREGPVTCQNGYLAIDSGGYPYPIAEEEFVAIYEEAGE